MWPEWIKPHVFLSLILPLATCWATGSPWPAIGHLDADPGVTATQRQLFPLWWHLKKSFHKCSPCSPTLASSCVCFVELPHHLQFVPSQQCFRWNVWYLFLWSCLPFQTFTFASLLMFVWGIVVMIPSSLYICSGSVFLLMHLGSFGSAIFNNIMAAKWATTTKHFALAGHCQSVKREYWC